MPPRFSPPPTARFSSGTFGSSRASRLRTEIGDLKSAMLLTVKVRVGVIEPVLADRAEEIELEGIVERLGLMLDP